MTYQRTFWYLAQCQVCEPGPVLSFPGEDSRDVWAVRHHDVTGHYVRIGTREQFRRVR